MRPIPEYCSPICCPFKNICGQNRKRSKKVYNANIAQRKKWQFEFSYRERTAHFDSSSLLLGRVIYDQNLLLSFFIDHNMLFNYLRVSDRTRSHHLGIFKGRVRSEQFLDSFMIRVASTWKNFPCQQLLSLSPVTFNQGLDVRGDLF